MCVCVYIYINCMWKVKSCGIPFSWKLSSKMHSIQTDWKAQWQAGPGILSITTHFFSTVCQTCLRRRYEPWLDYIVRYGLPVVSLQFSGPDSLPQCQNCSNTLLKTVMPSLCSFSHCLIYTWEWSVSSDILQVWVLVLAVSGSFDLLWYCDKMCTLLQTNEPSWFCLSQ